MYLWVLLATFMVALLSFNLSIRPDSDRALMETKAQTIITKFRVQHYGFAHYIASKKLTKAQLSSQDPLVKKDSVDYASKVGYNDGNVLGVPSELNEAITSELVNTQDIQKYLPYGFQTDATIYSKVFCFKPQTFESDENYDTVCENDISIPFDLRKTCCAASGTDVLVISWQKMPPRWISHTTQKPLSDMMSAMTKSEGYGSTIGFVTNVDDASGPVVSGGMYRTPIAQIDSEGKPTGKYTYELKYRPIYNILIEDDDFKDCVNENKIKNPCLIAINKVSNREENEDD